MKKLLLVPLLIVLIGAAAVIWFYLNVQPVSADKNFQSFLIVKGSSAGAIASNLEKDGFIRSALAFRIYIRVSGQESKIPTGEFRLSPSLSLFQTVDQLIKGPIQLWVTIPEGLRNEEVAARFTSGLDRDSAFTDEFLSAAQGLQGTLFPDTYLFPKDASASAIVKKMVATFDAKTSGLTAGPGLTFNQRIVLASILERETKTDTERSIVAGILINRLNAGMPLQVDASVQYAVGTPADWWPILSLENLKINSPYNTYQVTGLPPTPISNPGLSSLTAAFNPASTDYLYYIHDPGGVIHYAKTLAEHNANIAKYLGK